MILSHAKLKRVYMQNNLGNTLTYIIVPAYNEARFIGQFLDKLISSVAKSRVIVVDDGSIDKTKIIVQEKGITCLSHLVNLGKGAAIKTGCDYAFKKLHASSVIIMDGDDQHEVGDLKVFERALRQGHEIVLGVRSLDASMPLMRVLGNKSISVVINLLFHRYIADIPSGFKAFTKSAYRQIRWNSAGYEVETEIAVRIAKSHLDVLEVPISTIYHGKDYGFNLMDAFIILTKLPYWLWR